MSTNSWKQTLIESLKSKYVKEDFLDNNVKIEDDILSQHVLRHFGDNNKVLVVFYGPDTEVLYALQDNGNAIYTPFLEGSQVKDINWPSITWNLPPPLVVKMNYLVLTDKNDPIYEWSLINQHYDFTSRDILPVVNAVIDARLAPPSLSLEFRYLLNITSVCTVLEIF
jgi:hypothetical protein